MIFEKIDGERFYYMLINASNRLEEQKEYVNSLNVFPVPDGDTGTNMSMTFRAAISEIGDGSITSISEVAKKLSKGALMGARGNSGVILSQIFRGISKGLGDKPEVNAEEFAASILEGSKSAYKAVMRPTEGTILTIIRTAGEHAIKCKADNVTALMDEVCKHSEIILNKTPEMLPALKKANVVDSGGMGLLIVLKGMYEALNEELKPSIAEVSQKKEKPVSAAGNFSEQEIKFGYCTEFIIHAEHVNLEAFKSDLEQHGDSMVVVGLDDIVKVHIHTNDPGLVLSKALKLGELSKIKIDNMREEHRETLIRSEENAVENEKAEEDVVLGEAKDYAFIAVAMGEGIKNIFKDMGADYVIEGGQTMNPSTEDMINCINKLNASHIFILPNNKNIIMAAKQAADISDKNIHVLQSKAIPQGIAALTAFNPDKSLEENIAAMDTSMSNVSTGSITYAVRDTEIDGKSIKEGNILGLVDGKISEIGEDIYDVSMSVLADMVNEDSELITLLYGQDCDEEKVTDLAEKLEEKYPDIDIQCYNGKQPLYYFIISVE